VSAQPVEKPWFSAAEEVSVVATEKGHLIPLVLDCRPEVRDWKLTLSHSLGWKAELVLNGTRSGTLLSGVNCVDGQLLPGLAVAVERESADVAPPEWLQVQLNLDEAADRGSGKRWVFRREGGTLVEVPFAEYLKALNVGEEGELVLEFAGTVFEGEEWTRSLPPWESPYVPDDQKEHLRQLVEARLTADGAEDEGESGTGTEQHAFALVVAQGEEQAESETTGGCSIPGRSSRSETVVWILVITLGGLIVIRSRRRIWPSGRQVVRQGSGALLAAVIGGSALLGFAEEARAEQRMVYGYVSYWDTRPKPPTNKPGFRIWCDSQLQCDVPSTAGCCYRGIKRVKVELWKYIVPPPPYLSYWTLRSTAYSNNIGLYMLWEDNWSPGNYRIRIVYERDEAPFKTVLTGQTGQYAIRQWLPVFQFASQWHHIPSISVNIKPDTNSVEGDVATYWTTTTEAAYALEGGGDTRLRRLHGSQNQFDLIIQRYYGFLGAPDCNCATSTLRIRPGVVRGTSPAHELGHEFNCRLTGAQPNGWPVFPQRVGNQWSWHASEHSSIIEAIATLVALLTWWNPASAGLPDVLAHFAPCADVCVDDQSGVPVPCDNINDASSMRNNYLALWDFLDADTQGQVGGLDEMIVTVKQLMDALVSLQQSPGNQGQNRSGEEFWAVDTGWPCQWADDCYWGSICCYADTNPDYKTCHAGDVHGGNIRDWTWHLCQNLDYYGWYCWHTLESSPCIGPERNTSVPVFRGGYRDD
jgi:hypothetical protein